MSRFVFFSPSEVMYRVYANGLVRFSPYCRPSDPLRVLGEFLIQKSKEQESKA